MSEDELMANLIGDGISVEGFFARNWWYTPGYKYQLNSKGNNGWYAPLWYKN